MPRFDPTDPYPLARDGSYDYARAQAHSEEVDAWLGMRTHEIEARLRAAQDDTNRRSLNQQLWIGLSTRALLTPYTELRTLLTELDPKPGETVVDLGAGYGRMGFVLRRHFPEALFVGYELVRERVDEGNRCFERQESREGAAMPPAERFKLVQADLADPGFSPRHAEHYFLYDYGTRQAISKTLEDLKLIASRQAITVTGRGRASRDAIEREHPWLSQVVSPEHHGNFSIYRSA